MSIQLYPSIAKIKRNGVYENLPGFVPETGSVATQQMIATSESSNVAQYAHNKGEYFRLNDTLYQAIVRINVGDNIVVGTNCEVAVLGNDVTHIANSIAEYELGIATSAHATGEYFMVGETLYVAIDDIAVGDSISTLTNCRVAVVGDELSGLKADLNEISGQTYNLVIGKLIGLTVNTSGGMVNWGGSTDMIIAPVENGKTYTIKTDDTSGFVGGFYNTIPTASTTASYNNTRVLQASKTFVSPIDGYVAFRVSNGYKYAQIVEGSADRYYIEPRTAVDSIARIGISDVNTKLGEFTEHTYNLVIGKILAKTINASGGIVSNSQTDLWFSAVEENKTYTVQTKGSAGLVYGFFQDNPLEDITVITYNTSRTIASGTVYTFTAPITGYIGFTSVNDSTDIQITEGAESKPYLPPITTAIDIKARNMNDNILYGKILCCCGDSITYGADMDSDGITDQSNVVVYQSNSSGEFSPVSSGFLKTWNWQIAERNNMTLYNAGVSGSTMQGIADKNGFSLANGRYTKLPDNLDYLLIWFGWNDAAYGTLGSISDETNESYYGGYNVVLPYLINKYPYAKIGIIVPFGTDANHREAIRLLGNKWGVAVWDNYQGGTPLYYGKEDSVGVEADIVTANRAKFQANGAHPNYKGHTELGHMIEHWMRGL